MTSLLSISNHNATRRRLSYRTAFQAFDQIEDAHSNIEGTFAVLEHVLDGPAEGQESLILTLERHLKADRAALAAAITAARHTILKPLQAADHPGAAGKTVTKIIEQGEAGRWQERPTISF